MPEPRSTPKKKPAAKKKRAKKGPPAPTPVRFKTFSDVPEVTLREEGVAPALVYQAPPVSLPEIVTLEGHGNFVQALAFTPDGAQLVTGSEDATMRVWDLATRACVQTLTAHAAAVNCVCFTPDGAQLASASDDSTIKVWNARTWEVERTLSGHSGYVSEVHPAGQGRLVSSGNDGTVRLWDLATGECLSVMQQGSWVNAMDASPDGRYAVASSSNNVLRVWALATGEANTLVDASALNAGTVMGLILAGENRSGVGHGSFARHVAWSADGARYYSSSKEIIAWDAATGVEVSRVEGNGWEITGFALVPGGRELVAATHDAVSLFDFEAKRALAAVPFAHGGDTHMVAVSPDGRTVACGSQKGVVGVWSLDAMRAMRAPDHHVTAAFSVAVSPDGASLLTGGADRTAWWRDLATGASRTHGFGEGLFVSPVQYSRDGRRAFVMNDKATLVVLDARSGERLGTLRFPDTERYRPFSHVCELRDGRLLIGTVDGPLTVWDTTRFDRGPEDFEGDTGHVVSLAVDSEEQVAVTARYGSTVCELDAWNLADGTLRWHVSYDAGGYAACVRVVGGRVLASTSKGALLVLSLHDGALEHALQLSPGDYLGSIAVTAADEVVVLDKRPLRVNFVEGRLIERIALVPDHYFYYLADEPRALRVSATSVAVVDLVARTVTPACATGTTSSVTPTPASPFIAAASRTPERAGTAIVLRRGETTSLVVPSPTLAPYTAKKQSVKTTTKKSVKKTSVKKKAAG